MTKPDAKLSRLRVFEYPLAEGWKVLAGRTDADNEELSLKVARANDWWFHVRGTSGSHVVLQGPDGEEAGRSLLEQAAAIAAYHSKARTAGVVPVSYTRAGNVTKPRGAKTGTVQISKEKVIKIRPGTPRPPNPQPPTIP